MVSTSAKATKPLTRRERLRRVALLCLNCSRNVAFYRASAPYAKRRMPLGKHYLFAAIANNFLDIAVLEWCKLYGNKEPHGWSKVVSNKEKFFRGLLEHLGCTKKEFHDFRTNVLAYRTDFVGHLLEEREMQFPSLDMLIASVLYYYDYILAHENDGQTYQPDLVGDIKQDHAKRGADAKALYKREFG